MGLIDQIIGVESGGNPTAANPNSSAMGAKGSLAHMSLELVANARIGELLLACRPLAILGRVVAVAVFSINRVVRARLQPHVGEEVGEAVAPSCTNLDAARSVPFVRDVFLILASGDHATPRMIFSGGRDTFGKPARSAVGRVGLRNSLDLVAAAANGVAGSKVWHGHNGLCAAIALTKIATDGCAAILSDFWLSLSERDKFAETNSSTIYGGCH